MPDLLDRLGEAMLLRRDELLSLVRSAPHRYKVFYIPKRQEGQFRTIAQPAREVKKLQYWVIANVLRKFPIHSAATAYRAGRSILHNAQPHRRSRYVLKLDFKDFFPSLTADDFALHLRRSRFKFDRETTDALCRILFWKPKGEMGLRLSIGAPSSPLVSNVLMFQFDQKLSAICRKWSIRYTRYADDLTLSAVRTEGLRRVEREVELLCGRSKSPRIQLNGDKTARVSMREARRVTGLVLTNDQNISLGRDQKRRIRASVHHFAMQRLGQEQARSLAGTLAYVNSVEPDFLRRLESKYGSATIDAIRLSNAQ